MSNLGENNSTKGDQIQNISLEENDPFSTSEGGDRTHAATITTSNKDNDKSVEGPSVPAVTVVTPNAERIIGCDDTMDPSWPNPTIAEIHSFNESSSGSILTQSSVEQSSTIEAHQGPNVTALLQESAIIISPETATLPEAQQSVPLESSTVETLPEAQQSVPLESSTVETLPEAQESVPLESSTVETLPEAQESMPLESSTVETLPEAQQSMPLESSTVETLPEAQQSTPLELNTEKQAQQSMPLESSTVETLPEAQQSTPLELNTEKQAQKSGPPEPNTDETLQDVDSLHKFDKEHHPHSFAEYILAAEFDIDKGSTLRHAYPSKLNGFPDEYFAEHMLPEGAHNRERDWTCFIANRSTPPTSSTLLLGSKDQCKQNKQHNVSFKCLVTATSEPSRGGRGNSKYQYSWTTQFNNLDSEVFVLTVNHTERCLRLHYPVAPCTTSQKSNSEGVAVHVEHQTSQKSNAEGVAVHVEHQTSQKSNAEGVAVHVEHQIAPGDLWLETRVGSNNKQSLDYSIVDAFSSCWSHVADNNYSSTITAEQNDDPSRPRFTRIRVTFEFENEREQFEHELFKLLGEPVVEPFYYCYNIVCNKADRSARRGATVRALAIVTRYPFFHVLEPLLNVAIDEYFLDPESSTLEKVFYCINNINLKALPVLSSLEKQLIRREIDVPRHLHAPIHGSTHTFRGLAQWNCGNEVLQIPINIPYLCEPDEMGGASISLLLDKFGRDIMKIYNAVLQEKRVLFLAKMAPAGEVCDAVLSACSMLCPPLRGFAHRCFPYANLNDLSWLEVEGYIAGVTNPVFEGRSNWWDLLCNLDDGTVSVSSDLAIASAGATSKSGSPVRRASPVRNRSQSPRKSKRVSASSLRKVHESDSHGQELEQALRTDEVTNVKVAQRGRSSATSTMDTEMDTKAVPASSTWFGLDNEEDQLLVTRVLDGHRANFGDEWVKAQLRDYTEELTSMACGDYGVEKFRYPERNYSKDTGSMNDSKSTLSLVFSSASAEQRIQQWRYTRMFSSLVRQRQIRLVWWRQNRKLQTSFGTSGPIPGAWEYLRSGTFDMRRGVKKLNSGVQLSERELLDIFQTLATLLVHESDLQELLVLLPESKGGLEAVARGLFHHAEIIRNCTVQLLNRLEQHASTQGAVKRLNLFLLSSYYRQLDKLKLRTPEP